VQAVRREAILRIVAQIAPDKVDTIASLLPQASPRRRKSGTLVRHERDESIADEWRRQQAIKAAARELERQELRRANEGTTTIFIYDERIRFRRIPAPTSRHPVPSILAGRVRAGKARVVKYIIQLDEANLHVFDWSALLKQHRI
jgi:hypothetical protein